MSDQQGKKLLVMAGGTGGHIYPGIAVAEVLRERGWQIAWMGNTDRMEAKVVPPYGYEMAWIRFGALRGKGLKPILLLPLNILRGLWHAYVAMRRVKPDVVLGMGGYVSFPGAVVASLRGTPLVVHEQNSVAGLTNKVAAALADVVVTGFPKVLRRGRWVGNPVRAEMTTLPEPAVRFAGRSGPLRVLVVGGSLGAQALNAIVPKALALLPPGQRPRVVHQSGAAQIEDLHAQYAAAGVEGELLPFIDNMAERYAVADLVICRAGALTVAELAAVGVGSILVPLPIAVDDHQTWNAKFLSKCGAAELMPQAQLTPQVLADWLALVDRERLLLMAQAARGVAKPEAAPDVALYCESLCR
jgi:UDP-N-acetylglucosamine--N-acetylmuramyl-(pentapeptide) pyrophosphoryl-undecaprenol N-acetylglucosamine transferase